MEIPMTLETLEKELARLTALAVADQAVMAVLRRLADGKTDLVAEAEFVRANVAQRETRLREIQTLLDSGNRVSP
jgi:hypothetical protein